VSGGEAPLAPSGGELRIGISACLLGEKVRYDGGHKRDAFVNDTLGAFVAFVPVCPEVEVGMGTPREPIRLERRGAALRLVAPGSGTDHTDAMRRWAARRLEDLAALDLSGYILKKDSPSCGMERVRVYDEGGVPAKAGRGLFAAALIERLPDLPVEEEGRLHDPVLRECFVERVFAYRRLVDFFARRFTQGELVRFHTAEKLLLLAHEPAAYQALGRLVAGAKRLPREDIARRYRAAYMAALEKPATVRRHVNVLQHMAGYFKTLLSEDERRELQETIGDYRRRLVPLVVPITLIRHHVRRHGVAYLAGQVYLAPHPKELMLRNHA
jgi:uncharacterized protein YbgA (DUF1722 family)/uncharacterized protein YbbK (DUF523 family)